MAAGMLGMKMMAPGLEVMLSGPDFNEQIGVPRNTNEVYCAADVFVSTSHGEGFRLTTTDAMAACCPVVVPGTRHLSRLSEQERSADIW